jgi:hypothetical protein
MIRKNLISFFVFVAVFAASIPGQTLYADRRRKRVVEQQVAKPVIVTQSTPRPKKLRPRSIPVVQQEKTVVDIPNFDDLEAKKSFLKKHWKKLVATLGVAGATTFAFSLFESEHVSKKYFEPKDKSRSPIKGFKNALRLISGNDPK